MNNAANRFKLHILVIIRFATVKEIERLGVRLDRADSFKKSFIEPKFLSVKYELSKEFGPKY